MGADVETVIKALVQARLEEGAKLRKILGEKLETIKTLVTEATTLAKEHPAILKNRLEETINKLLENKEEFDPERLHQEAVLLAVKADVAEELDRLQAHIEQAASLLESGKPIGRRLDFLCQEFNREANTLCSKSQSKELTYIGLELKTVIDQFREQVQNIE